MTDLPPVREVTAADLDKLVDATNRLASVATRVTSTSGVHIHGSGLLAVCVALIGFVGIVVAVAAVFVVSAWRDADLRDLTRVRGDVRELQAYRVIQSDAITKLEAERVQPNP